MNQTLRLISPGLLVITVGATLVGCSSSDDDGATASSTAAPTSAAVSGAPDASAGNPGGGSLEDAITGTWSGDWERTAPIPGNGTMDLELTNDGGDLSGTITVTGSACMTSHDVTGTLDGDDVTFAVSDGGITASYEGSVDGTDLSGTMTVTCPDVGTGTGTWTVSQ
jgi:hypothetical protein